MVAYGIIISIVVVMIYMNLVATYHAINSEYYDSTQKKLQLLLTWLVPFLGSFVVILFALSDKEYIRAEKSKTGPRAKLFRLITLAAFVGASGNSVTASDDSGSDVTSSSDGGSSGGGDN